MEHQTEPAPQQLITDSAGVRKVAWRLLTQTASGPWSGQTTETHANKSIGLPRFTPQNQTKRKNLELAVREQLLTSPIKDHGDLIHWPVNMGHLESELDTEREVGLGWPTPACASCARYSDDHIGDLATKPSTGFVHFPASGTCFPPRGASRLTFCARQPSCEHAFA
jgi:hypothetical protein